MAKNKLVDNINSIIDEENDKLKNSVDNATIKNIKKTVEDETKDVSENLEKTTEAVKKEAKDTIMSATKELDKEIQNININAQVKEQIENINVNKIVTELIDNQVDSIVKDQVKKARSVYNDSSISTAINTAEAYYSKILNSEKLMSDMRDDYTNAINKQISKKIIGVFDNLNIGGKWGQKILPASLIGKQISNVVTASIQTLINSVASNKAIAKVSKDIVDTVNRLKKAAAEKIKDTFTSQIAYAKKLKKAIEDKIDLFNKKKDEYIKKMQAYVDKLQTAITEQIAKIEQAMINEISKFIQLNVSKLAGGLGL